MVLLPVAAAAQDAPRFDVATIKPVQGPITFSADPRVRGRAVYSTASTLRDLVEYAFGVRWDSVTGGPAWATSERYDLAARARADGALTSAQAKQMMQLLLADRLHLLVHRENQQGPEWFPANRAAPPDLDMPDMFAALEEQLGLKLEAAKAPRPMLVIDRAEKPSGN